ncbi:MAG: PilZ domain-containing protein [Sphingopyxis sp.]|uniref:PilZ domain-containing protein n=1 Tax=Sphingopyxis sp. TaxID=1908224 RepID=UPI003D80CD20
MRKIDLKKAHYVGLDQRIAPRSDVYSRLPFVLPDGRQEMCTCVNISADGLLMRYERGLEIGDLVVFRMPIIGRAAAKVVWSLGGKTGVQFEKTISVEDYLPMIRAMGARGDLN